MIRIHANVDAGQPEAYRRAVLGSADMIECTFDSDAEAFRAGGMRPEALLVRYKIVTMGWDVPGAASSPYWQNTVAGGALEESEVLHHLDGRPWDAIDLPGAWPPYSTRPRGTHRFVNPGSLSLRVKALAERSRQIALGFAGWRYDEALVGWLAGASIDFSDCREHPSRASYVNALCSFLAALRTAPGGWLQFPSIPGFWESDSARIGAACAGLSSEGFTSGAGIVADWQGEFGDNNVIPETLLTQVVGDAEVDAAGNATIAAPGIAKVARARQVMVTYSNQRRSVQSVARLADLLRRAVTSYSCIFYAGFAMGLGDVSAMAAGFRGSRVYWNLDSFRDPATGLLPPWVS